MKINKSILVFIIIVTILINSNTNAQTPASLPGITPGTTTTSGDGGPEVPFDGGISLMLAASGIAYVTKKRKNKATLA